MKKPHLSEEEIQQAAQEPAACKPEILTHLQSCDDCKAKVANYQLLFSGLASLPAPVADLSLQNAIMDKIAGERAGLKWPGLSIGLVSVFAVTVVATLIWLNPQLFSLLLSSLSTNVAALTLFSAVMIVAFYGWLIYKKYTQQMQLLEKL